MIRLLADENILGLEALPGDEVDVRTIAGRGLRREDLRDIDALWVRSVTRVDGELLGNTRLKFVGTATAGVDHIDQEELMRRDIAFAAAPGANANAVVEYVLAALLELEAPWQALEQGGTLGIVGYGHVGRRLAAVADAMGWSVKVSDPLLDAADRPLLPLEAILDCAVISLHASLHRSSPWPSHHLLSDGQLDALTTDQTLVNASRGAVVDNQALRRRLGRADAPRVVLDVWEPEPGFDVRLLDCPTLQLATPHIAGYSWHAKWNATQMLWAAMGERGLVQREALKPPSRENAQALDVGQGALDAAALMRCSYRIADDDARLRRIGTQAREELGASFDALRKNHPTRYELAATDMGEIALKSDALKLARALRSPTGS